MNDDLPGKPYRPSNGTSGEMFEGAFCSRCTRDFRQNCSILARMMLHEIEDKRYPKEVRYDDAGEPTCTAFQDKATVIPKPRRRIKPSSRQSALFAQEET